MRCGFAKLFSILGLFVITVPVGGQTSLPPESRRAQELRGLDRGIHVVRPGDTMERLAARYLGDSGRWQEIWELNPEIANPQRIFPRQHLNVPLPGKLPRNMAQVTKVSRRVESRPVPVPWEAAVEMSLCRPGDGIRTFELSSAELLFHDATRLVLTEQSLVYLGRTAPAPATVERELIEIVEGQADLEAAAASAASSEIEIILGDARAKPRRGASGELQTRARRPQGGGAQLMVYSGESELEAGGSKVRVATGMGSAVQQGASPSPPEELLPAVELAAPAAEGTWPNGGPPFRWQPIEGAASYTLEVCRDATCGRLVAKADAIATPSWQPAELPLGEHYLRVTAVGLSGLDGYPSEPRAFQVVAQVTDVTGPEIAITFVGPQMAPRYGLNERRILGPGFRVDVAVSDTDSGVESWQPLIDGRQATAADLAGSWSAGEHQLQIVAVDRAGNRAEIREIFIFDPDPPTLAWGIEGQAGAMLLEMPTEAAHEPDQRGRSLWSPSGKWAWSLDSDHGQVIARPRQRQRIPGSDLTLDRERGLWVLAEDVICREVAQLFYDIVDRDQRPFLVIEATDCVGNRSRGEWPLARSR